jgi:menaquinone-dependent protoporphyrinogen oxidase
MRVLVTAAGKHGSTEEIADAIGRAIRATGVEADVRPIGEKGDLDGYDAVVLGGGVYYGHWVEPARRFAEEHAAELVDRAVWLFSSGPLGDQPAGEVVDVEDLIQRLGAREHRVFAGRLDLARLRFTERAVAKAVKAPEGDFRDWDAIIEWGHAIGRSLSASSS